VTRNAYRDSVVGHVPRHHAIRAYRDLAADPDITYDLGAGPDVDVISDNRVAFAGTSVGLPKRDTLRYVAVSAYHSRSCTTIWPEWPT
jgi:hypothetical protein